MSNTVTFTPESYKLFKQEYDKAVSNHQTQFKFEGNDYLTVYAKYVCEYLDSKFKFYGSL